MSKVRGGFEEPIVVTGYGCVSPLGLTASETWNAIVEGKSGITNLPDDLQGNPFEVKTVAQVKGFSDELLSERTGINKAEFRKIHPSGQFALMACAEALQQAGLAEPNSVKLKESIDPRTVGTMIGSGIAGADKVIDANDAIRSGKNPSVAVALSALPDREVSIPARSIGAKGPIASYVGACATGNMSIIGGLRVLRLKEADIMIAGSTEAQITPYALGMFDRLRAVDRIADPDLASRPFNKTANGFVLGEGGGILILERLSSAKRRGAAIFAEVVGYGDTCDASESDTLLDGVGAKQALRNALETSGDYQAAYINAHATGTMGDAIEMQVIRDCFERERTVGVGSTKGASGHMVGGAGSAEAIISIMALNSSIIPPTLKLDDPVEEAIDWPMSPNASTPDKEIDLAVNNSFGFGGLNAVTAFKKREE